MFAQIIWVPLNLQAKLLKHGWKTLLLALQNDDFESIGYLIDSGMLRHSAHSIKLTLEDSDSEDTIVKMTSPWQYNF